MPTNQSVTLVKGTVSDGTCFDSVSDLYNTFVNLTTAYVDGDYSLFNFGDTEPSASDIDKPWIRTIGGKPDRIYVYKDGGWLSKHPVPAYVNGIGERRMFVGAASDIDTYDGGTSGGVGSSSGPFWEKDTDFDGKFPVGYGTTASGKEITEGNPSGGIDETVLEEKHLPPHSHSLNYSIRSFRSGSSDTGEGKFASGSNVVEGMVTAGSSQLSVPFTNLPPYKGVYIIKRTIRVYYKA